MISSQPIKELFFTLDWWFSEKSSNWFLTLNRGSKKSKDQGQRFYPKLPVLSFMKIASSLNSCNKSFQVLLILTIFRKLELDFGNFQKLGTVLSFDSVFFQKTRAQCDLISENNLISETLNDQNQRLSTKSKKCITLENITGQMDASTRV
jgi:hypothetical protein